MKKQFLRRLAAVVLSVLTLWMTLITTGSDSLSSAMNQMKTRSTLITAILHWELGDFFGTDLLTAVNVLALRQSPLLLQQRNAIASLMAQSLIDTPTKEPVKEPEPDTQSTPPTDTTASYDGLTFTDNGVPSQTVIPTATKGYTVVNGVYIKNTSSRQLVAEELAAKAYTARLAEQGPQVLIIHSHATEAYTMPEGQSYEASGTYRTKDTNYNMVRVGDEVASVLSTYGISVLHDRALHDAASYNDAYSSSSDSIQQYLDKYPTITFVLDIHRDAIQDANGNQYKLVTKEDPRVAQCCLVMGVAHDGWKDNLQLAVAVQETLNSLSPTLMRPVAARGYRYNQQFRAGSMLVEIGAAGNSLDEAIMGARYFAKGLAETILKDA